MSYLGLSSSSTSVSMEDLSKFPNLVETQQKTGLGNVPSLVVERGDIVPIPVQVRDNVTVRAEPIDKGTILVIEHFPNPVPPDVIPIPVPEIIPVIPTIPIVEIDIPHPFDKIVPTPKKEDDKPGKKKPPLKKDDEDPEPDRKNPNPNIPVTIMDHDFPLPVTELPDHSPGGKGDSICCP